MSRSVLSPAMAAAVHADGLVERAGSSARRPVSKVLHHGFIPVRATSFRLRLPRRRAGCAPPTAPPPSKVGHNIRRCMNERVRVCACGPVTAGAWRWRCAPRWTRCKDKHSTLCSFAASVFLGRPGGGRLPDVHDKELASAAPPTQTRSPVTRAPLIWINLSQAAFGDQSSGGGPHVGCSGSSTIHV